MVLGLYASFKPVIDNDQFDNVKTKEKFGRLGIPEASVRLH
jgi:hypothetical protein